jgi:hypothetical protein
MPLKRRRPKERMVTITARALELFNELGQHPRGCELWYDIHALLHKEVDAKPWEYPLDSMNATHIWEALENAAAAAELREREKTAPATS